MNLQNVPQRNEEAVNVKRIFKAKEGWVFMASDLSSAEMRIGQICSGDKKLEEIFQQGIDIHGSIAKEVFSLDCHANEVKHKYPELRTISKTIQFLSLYGGGALTLSSKIKITPDRADAILKEIMVEIGVALDTGEVDKKGKTKYEYPKLTSLKGNKEAAELLVDKFQIPSLLANRVLMSKKPVNALMSAFQKTTEECQQILDNYFEKYPGIDQYIKDIIEFTKKNGYSMSLLGRKRRVPAVSSTDKGVIERAVRQAVNATIQSLASDCLMYSLCDIQENYIDDWSNIAHKYGYASDSECPMRVFATIHDSIECEAKVEFLMQAKEIMETCMCKYPEPLKGVTIPMLADTEHGLDWASTTESFENLHEIYKDIYEEEEE